MDQAPEWSQPKKLTDDPHVNLFTTEAAAARGLRHWTFASRRATGVRAGGEADAAVVIGIVTGNGIPKVVLTREYRVPLRAFELSVPSGLIDPGERAADAARREFHEETGLRLDRIVHVSPPVASSAGLTDETVALVYGEASGELSRGLQTEHELIEAWLADLSDLRRLLASPGADVISSRVYPILLGYVCAGRIALPRI